MVYNYQGTPEWLLDRDRLIRKLRTKGPERMTAEEIKYLAHLLAETVNRSKAKMIEQMKEHERIMKEKILPVLKELKTASEHLKKTREADANRPGQL